MAEEILYIKANIDDINSKLNDLDKKFAKTKKGAETAGDTIEEGMGDAGKATEKTGEAVSGLTGRLDKLTGGAVTGFKNMLGGIKKAIVSFKSLRVAIIATGIGALVVAIASVTAAFTSSAEGQNKFAKILGVISTVSGNVIDLFADLGEKIINAFENPKESLQSFTDLIKTQLFNRVTGLIELFPALGEAISLVFQGEFTKAAEVAANATGKIVFGINDTVDATKSLLDVTGDFINEQQREIKISQKISDQRAKADKLERDLIVEKAEAEGKIADLRLKARQEDQFSAAQRNKFLEEAIELNDKIVSKEKESKQLRADAIIAENQLSKSTKEDLTAEEEAKAELLVLERKRLSFQRKIEAESQSLTKKLIAQSKAEVKAREDAIAAIDEALRTERENEITEVRAKYKVLTTLAVKYGRDTVELERKRLAELNALDPQTIEINNILDATQSRIDAEIELEKEASIEKLAIRQDEAAKQDALEQKRLQNTADRIASEQQAQLEASTYLFSQLKVLYADNAEAQKVFAIFDATISAYQAIVRALEAGPIAGPILAAAIGALAFAQVAKIASEPVPQYFEGTDFVPLGKNKKGRDTVPAMLHEGEAVIQSKRNKQYPGLSTAFNTGKIDEYIRARQVNMAVDKIKQDQRVQEFKMMGNTNVNLNDKRIVNELKRNNKATELMIELLASQRVKYNPYRA